jgi:YegS/Rv2252/BmrU family lipid kinase
MRCKKACLVVDLIDGEHMTNIPDLNAVLAAAGWSTDIAVKEYGGEAMKLANKAVKKGYDLVISYGGDGTLNQVLNGVMSANGKGRRDSASCLSVGAIPGGTANEWAGEMGIPLEPMQAALTLVNSDARKVDLGHVGVKGLILPESGQSRTPSHDKKVKVPSKTKSHFLLMAGLGMDARVIAHISKSLKYRVGSLAFDAATIKELPSQRPFPAEIWDMSNGSTGRLLWQGEAWQVIVANARRYGNIVDVAPDAHLDDGILDLCVFTEGNMLSTVEQIASLLFRHKPDSKTAKFFRSSHFSIRVPASIGMHLDGSLTELKDYLSKSKRNALADADSPEDVMVDYRFDAEPGALSIAIPRTYSGPLFEKSAHDEQPHATAQQQQDNTSAEETRDTEPAEAMSKLLEHGTKVTVVAVGPNPEKKDTYIIAGTTQKAHTGETEPVAIRVNSRVTLLKRNGESTMPSSVQDLQSGAEIVVDGKKSKRGVIRARRVVI